MEGCSSYRADRLPMNLHLTDTTSIGTYGKMITYFYLIFPTST